MIGFSPSLDYSMSRTLERIADENGIARQCEIMSGSTGTNADEIQVAGSGVRMGLISIPQRNMHTAAEIVDLNDIEAVARGEMRRSRSYNAEKRLVTPHRHLLRSKDPCIYSADARKFYKAAVVDSGNGHSNSVYMSVEQDMHPVAARNSAQAAERVNMRKQKLFDH